MRLAILLYGLYLKLARAARTDKDFRNYIGNIQLRILIKTADNRWGRLFVFDRGRVRSESGADHPSDAALVWSDPATAFKVMLKGSDEATFHAAAQGKLRVEGMAYYIQWFNDAVKLVM
jgi:hypothetical protein